MSKTEFHFQISFQASSEASIKNLYDILPDDKILMAVWVSSNKHSILDRKGFVFTENGFYWNYPAIMESNLDTDSVKERQSRNFDFLSKKDTGFIGTEIRDIQNAENSESKKQLILKTAENIFTFDFTSIKQEKLVLLERAVTTLFSGSFDSKSYSKEDEGFSLPLTYLFLCDFFEELCKKTKEVVKSLFRKTNTTKKNKSDAGKKQENEPKKETTEKQKSESESEPKSESKNESDSLKSENNKETINPEKKKNKFLDFLKSVGYFLLQVLDFCTDLTLIFSICIFIKPQLLDRNSFFLWMDKLYGVTVALFVGLQNTVLSDEINFRKNVILILGIILFVILKMLISLLSKRNRKAVTFLLVTMIVVDIILLIVSKGSFLYIIALLLFLQLVALQFSIGFSNRVEKIKIPIFIIACVTGYVALHFIAYPGFKELFNLIFQILSLTSN